MLYVLNESERNKKFAPVAGVRNKVSNESSVQAISVSTSNQATRKTVH